MRPPLHSRVPSADIGALNLHEYFSPLSIGLNNAFDVQCLAGMQELANPHQGYILQGKQAFYYL